MLDEYQEQQKKLYKILNNEIQTNKYSHAYLFETNGNPNTMLFVLAFVKSLLCPFKYTNNSKCVNCTICHKIDNNIYTDLKIIEPDGLWIKKEQLDSLQKEFSVKSVEGNKKIYIINQAEKLNVQASNSILKFLEEPEENIIAILITNNIYQMLSTIVSRCQVLSLESETSNLSLNLNIPSDKIKENLDVINDFVQYLETNELDTLLMTKKMWHDFYKERNDYLIGFELLLMYYKDVLNNKLDRKLQVFYEYESEINKVSEKNSFDKLIYKINKIISLKEYIKVNANQNLLLDKLIIELVGGEYNE